ncbi:hypothetical protein [Verminephrobacter aporrectodeae]|uniref:hypothetical protein n=1 Tax=Verminephrobacter aporrectodeae TaxID=1110389 RepID=UPI0022447B3C|nr:hypothetical protein [Verminephrobacter aporrectodeae]
MRNAIQFDAGYGAAPGLDLADGNARQIDRVAQLFLGQSAAFPGAADASPEFISGEWHGVLPGLLPTYKRWKNNLFMSINGL